MKRMALQIMQKCGVFTFTRLTSARMARILMYHNFAESNETNQDAVCVDALRKQLSCLRRKFKVVPLRTIAEHLTRGMELDPLCVAVTIDDGRRNCYQVLFPLLKEFGIPATLFVVTSFIEGEDWIWTDKVLWLSARSQMPELASDVIDDQFARLNRLRPEMRNSWIEEAARCAGCSIPKSPPEAYSPCSWSELGEMADSGLLEIGSHTVSHPILASITEAESWDELTNSRLQIQRRLGRPALSFCFPNGKGGDYSAAQLRQVEEAGYECAVAAQWGMVTNSSSRYELPRIGVSGSSDVLSFSKELEGVEHYQKQILESLRTRH